MSAERGWIGDPQPSVEWHDSHYSRMAEKVAQKAEEEQKRAIDRHNEATG